MKFMQTEKKQLLIYVIIAYGITYVMGLLMWYGYGKGLDLTMSLTLSKSRNRKHL